MCLAAMHLCGIERAFFAYSNEEGEPYGLSTAPVYAQMALPPAGQSLPLLGLKPRGEHGLYDAWRRTDA
jgi:tRNA(Arg) A34 adenosine deaminase TadA